MKIMLTDRTLRAMKPAAPGTRKMLWDAAVPSEVDPVMRTRGG